MLREAIITTSDANLEGDRHATMAAEIIDSVDTSQLRGHERANLQDAIARRFRSELASERDNFKRLRQSALDAGCEEVTICMGCGKRDCDCPCGTSKSLVNVRAERAEAAYADYRRLFGTIAALPRDYTSPEVFDRAVDQIAADALSMDAGRVYAERIERYREAHEAAKDVIATLPGDPLAEQHAAWRRWMAAYEALQETER